MNGSFLLGLRPVNMIDENPYIHRKRYDRRLNGKADPPRSDLTDPSILMRSRKNPIGIEGSTLQSLNTDVLILLPCFVGATSTLILGGGFNWVNVPI